MHIGRFSARAGRRVHGRGALADPGRCRADERPAPEAEGLRRLSHAWAPGALLVLAMLAGALLPGSARPDDALSVAIAIKDHQFTPSEIHVPAGKPVALEIKNEDATAEEFDSRSLKVEKVIAGGKSGTVRIRPLEKGRYPFVGEYHESTAKGVVVAE